MIDDHNVIEQRQQMFGEPANDVGFVLDHHHGNGPQLARRTFIRSDSQVRSARGSCFATLATAPVHEMHKWIETGFRDIAVRQQIVFG